MLLASDARQPEPPRRRFFTAGSWLRNSHLVGQSAPQYPRSIAHAPETLRRPLPRLASAQSRIRRRRAHRDICASRGSRFKIEDSPEPRIGNFRLEISERNSPVLASRTQGRKSAAKITTQDLAAERFWPG